MLGTIFKKRNKKRNLYKKKLSLDQKDHLLYIEGSLNNKIFTVKELWLVSRNNNQTIKMTAEQPSSDFKFEINLLATFNLKDNFADIFDLYINISVSKKNLSENDLKKLQNRGNIQQYNDNCIEFPIRLGRFNHTSTENIKPIELNGNTFSLFKTNKGNISIAVNHPLAPKASTQINALKSKKNHIKISGKIFTKTFEIETCDLILKGRENNKEAKVNIELDYLELETEQKFGLNRYQFKSNLDLNLIVNHNELCEDIYDAYLEIKYKHYNDAIRVRLGKPRFKARWNIKSAFAVKDNKTLAINPYYTIKFFNLSFQADAFDIETYQYMRKLMRWHWLIKFIYRPKDIWIVGERPYKAQDTGYHFFKYMRKNHPNKNVYYVIEEDSPELKNIEHYGNILYFKSKKHILYVLAATRIIGSHHADYLYPLRTDEFKRKVKATKVFLQHGIIGTKNTVHFYGKTSNSFETDLFLVSSDFEKNIIIKDFGYKEKEVEITGLSRFDSLFKSDVKLKRQLLIIPTWREWLVSEDKFLESEYFKRYRSLINNQKLHELAEKYNFNIIFCLHPNMQIYTPYFKDSPVQVISQGEVDVQYLIKESALMLTDYSSVAFDFSFLNKPVLYYQFDRSIFIGKKGSHLNLDEDLPGDILFEESEVLNCIEDYAKNDFIMKAEYQKKAAKFIKYKDAQSSKRIYHAVKKAKKKSLAAKILESEILNKIFMRFRKSRYYFPVMKMFYNIARKVLPVDKKLILFESGIGKQYADSPKFIYEKIIKSGLKYKFVWVNNSNIRFEDNNTIKIKRLSPKYYYYLARAKYWVNNQNFPTYIKKRPQTIYLQTWHGTPLKKMLYDMKEVHGRSDDYIERVGKAIKNWDYLISPSPYATKAFKSAFRYKNEVLEVGYPRNDIFYKEDRRKLAQKVRNKLHLKQNKKIILYAPTFRDNQTLRKNKFYFDINMDLNLMKESLGKDYVLLLRMHVVISNQIEIDETLQDFVYNVSDYPDIQELLLIADILITDYSSVMFDFANTGKPMLFYTYDLENYRDQIRGFYMDLEEEAPGPLVNNTNEIINSIKNIDRIKEDYQNKYNAFKQKYCPLDDGFASQRVVDFLFK